MCILSSLAWYRISELRAELDRRGDTEKALEEQTREQEVAIMELEASLASVREEIDERQLEVRGVVRYHNVMRGAGDSWVQV